MSTLKGRPRLKPIFQEYCAGVPATLRSTGFNFMRSLAKVFDGGASDIPTQKHYVVIGMSDAKHYLSYTFVAGQHRATGIALTPADLLDRLARDIDDYYQAPAQVDEEDAEWYQEALESAEGGKSDEQ